MTKYRICLCAMVAFLLILAVSFFEQQESLPNSRLITVEVTSNGETEIIECWEKEDVYYVFLPSYADLSQARIKRNAEIPVKINDEHVTENLTCDEFQLGVPYELTYTSWKKEHRYSIIFMHSSNIAAMYLDTDSGRMDYIHEKKGNEESGRVSVYTAEGTLDYAGELLSMNGRGNNTWEYFEKKAYSLKLSEETDLLGMGQAQKWILLANADDPSHMRNKITYDFADQVGLAYSPDSRWVDLYLNGEYAGLYLLCERNELHPERIDIAPADSFVVSLEKSDRLAPQNYAHVITEAKQALRIHYPENPTNEKLADLSATWQSVENAILAEDGMDAATGKSWLELIELESWVNKYLIEEIFANGDACFISQYFYLDGREKDGKIYAGPVWDFDHSLGTRKAWALTAPNVFYANRLHVKDGFDAPWFHALYQKEVFYDRMVEAYATVFVPALEDLLNNQIQKYAEQIAQAAAMDHIRWWVESEGIHSEAEEISTFLEQRVAFLNDVWLMNADFYMVKADQGFGGFYPYYAVYPGDCLTLLQELEDTEYSVFMGWYYKDTDEPFDPDKPITEDIEIYAKWEDSPSKRLGQVGKLLPLGIIAVMGIILLVMDVRKHWRR